MEHRLTTIDNPYDPFTQYTEWNQYDESMGYYTSAYLARVLTSSEELSDLDQEIDNEVAIDSIVREDPSGIYKKVSRNKRPIDD